MAMASSGNSATARLTAAPVASASSTPEFAVVQRGYHRDQVDRFVHWALQKIEELGREAGSVLTQEAASPQGRRLMAEVLQIVADEATGQQAAAAEMAAQVIAGAEEQAAMIIEEARRSADTTSANAQSQAGALISNAQAQARQMTDEAAAHAASVNEGANQRLAALVQFHTDTITAIQRLNAAADQVKAHTDQVLAGEQQRGPLADEVTRAMAQVHR